MDTLFPHADANESHPEPGQLQDLLLNCQKSLIYGMVEISYTPDDRFLLFFANNEVVGLYRFAREGIWERVPSSDPGVAVKNVKSTMRILPLPLEGVRIGKIMAECIKTGNTIPISTSGLKDRLDAWNVLPQTKMVNIHWPNAEAAVILPGYRLPIKTVLFITREQTIAGEKMLSRITSWQESQSEVRVYDDEAKLDAFLEYHLHLYFTNSLESILNRYREVAGASLANRASGEMNDLAQQRGWHIQSMDGKIIDQQIFSEPKQAFDAFQGISGFCLTQIEAVIGAKLTSTIVNETIDALDKTGQEILQRYPFLHSDMLKE